MTHLKAMIMGYMIMELGDLACIMHALKICIHSPARGPTRRDDPNGWDHPNHPNLSPSTRTRACSLLSSPRGKIVDHNESVTLVTT